MSSLGKPGANSGTYIGNLACCFPILGLCVCVYVCVHMHVFLLHRSSSVLPVKDIKEEEFCQELLIN